MPLYTNLITLYLYTHRVDDLQKQKQKEEQASSDEHLILKPLTFEGHVVHRLSDWCTVIPLVDVVAKLETVEV